MSRLGGIIGGVLRDRIEDDLLPEGKRMQKQIAKEKAKSWEKQYADSQKGMTCWHYLTHTGQFKELPAWWE